jgi:hypothetical protein
MSDQEQKTPEGLPAPQEVKPAKKLPTFKEFLETAPPDIQMVVTERAAGPYSDGGITMLAPYYRLTTPELDLHCEYCDGTRAFQYTGPTLATLYSGVTFQELDYTCKNCKEGKKYVKRFCLAVVGDGKTGPVQKIGEFPAYNPVISRKVFDLIGEDHREMFLQGRRAELRGLGIGAFAYYRRIVDDQKDRIIDRLKGVARRVGADKEVLELFENAKVEDQFTKAVKKIKDALPQVLFIDGHNPLTILYDVLSDGIHDLTDEECLWHARTARILLVALAERMSEISRDEAKVREAIGTFLTRKQPKPS